MRRTSRTATLVFLAAMVAALSTGYGTARAAAHGWLGVVTQQLTDDLRDALDLHDNGVLVNTIVPDSPADKAGLHRGDVITTFDTHAVDSPGRLSQLVGDEGGGHVAQLGIVRHGDRRTLSVTLGERPEGDGMNARPKVSIDSDAPEAPEPPEAPTPPSGDEDNPRVHVSPRIHIVGPDGSEHDLEGLAKLKALGDLDNGPMRMFTMNMGRGRLGVHVQPLSEDMASALDASGTHGVLVLDVVERSPAEKAGLKAGDILTDVEGRPVSTPDELVKALRDEKGKVSLGVTRRGAKRTVEAELEEAPGMHGGDGSMGMGRMGDLDRQMKVRIERDSDRDDLRKQIDELREQLRDLKKQLEEHQN